MGFYEFAKVPAYTFFKGVYRVEVSGVENIPKNNGVLLCSNHINNLDPPLLGSLFPRPLHYMAKAELFNVPILGPLITRLNAFPVKRGMGDRQALKKGLKILEDGNVLLLFPEGTRNKTGELGKGLGGAGFFAVRSQARVLPCIIFGSYRPFSKMKVVFGKPIDFTDLRERRASATTATERIMKGLQTLMDEERKVADNSKA